MSEKHDQSVRIGDGATVSNSAVGAGAQVISHSVTGASHPPRENPPALLTRNALRGALIALGGAIIAGLITNALWSWVAPLLKALHVTP
jgi:hypothetical protein